MNRPRKNVKMYIIRFNGIHEMPEETIIFVLKGRVNRGPFCVMRHFGGAAVNSSGVRTKVRLRSARDKMNPPLTRIV